MAGKSGVRAWIMDVLHSFAPWFAPMAFIFGGGCVRLGWLARCALLPLTRFGGIFAPVGWSQLVRA